MHISCRPCLFLVLRSLSLVCHLPSLVLLSFPSLSISSTNFWLRSTNLVLLSFFPFKNAPYCSLVFLSREMCLLLAGGEFQSHRDQQRVKAPPLSIGLNKEQPHECFRRERGEKQDDAIWWARKWCRSIFEIIQSLRGGCLRVAEELCQVGDNALCFLNKMHKQEIPGSFPQKQ